MPHRPTRRRLSRTGLLALVAGLLSAGPAVAQVVVKPAEGRREYDTPGLVLETGARTAACDVLTFTADGRHLLAAGDDKLARTWAVSDRGALGPDDLPALRWPIFREHRGNIYALALSSDRDQRRVLVAGNGRVGGGFAAAVIDRLTGDILYGTDNPPGQPQQGAIWSAAFSPSGDRVALGTGGGAVWVWDLPTGKFRLAGKHDPLPEGPRVYLVAFDGEDRVVSVAGKEMCRWDLADPGRKELLHTFGGLVNATAALSPDRKWVAAIPESPAGEWYSVELVSFPDGRVKRKITTPDRWQALPQPRTDFWQEVPHRLAFSRAGRYLAVALRRIGRPGPGSDVTFFQERDGRVLVYDLTLGDNQAPADGPRQSLYAEALAFHPAHDDWLAVAGGDNHDVVLWDWRANRKLGEVNQPGHCLWGVALSPDGNCVAFQTGRDHHPRDPNRRGTGPWRYFDLTTRKFLDDPPFAPKPPASSGGGWTVSTLGPDGQPSVYWAVERNGKRYELPWSRAEDEFPRCYAFIPATPTAPERLAVGHYWGVSVFDLTPDGPRRIRLFRGHEGYVSSLAVSADGKRLVTASKDLTLAGWSLEDWPYHPRLGAELFVRDDKLLVGKVAVGGPLWEMGVDPGCEIVGIESSFYRDGKAAAHGGYVKERLVNDGRAVAPVGTARDGLAFVTEPNQFFVPGPQHIFYWRKPGDPQVYAGATNLIDRPLWRFFPSGERDWVLWRWRDYYYDCSPQGDFRIGWQRSDPLAKKRKPEFFRAEQFRSEFLRPEKLSRALRAGPDETTLVRFNQIEPPEVTLSAPERVATGYRVTVTAKARGSRPTQQPGEVLVWLNDYLLTDLKGGDVPVTDGVYRGTVTVTEDRLRHGENVILAQCYGRGGSRGDSDPRTVRRAGGVAGRTLHALLIGVGDYSAAKPVPQAPLHAARDARVLARALARQKGKGVFADVTITPLLDRAATRDAILSGLDGLAKAVRPDDLLVVYLGGHGTSLASLREKKVPATKLAGLDRFLFLCPTFDLDRLPDTTVGFEELEARLAKLPCRKLVLLDACHSGEARTAGGDTDAHPVRILTRHGVGCVVLAACGADEEAVESPAVDPLGGGSGLFTVALRRLLVQPGAFAAADRDGDGVLDAAEVAAGVEQQVAGLVADLNDLAKVNGVKGEVHQTPVVFVPRREAHGPVAGK